MTRDDLQQVFERNEVLTRFYTFGGAGGGNCFALERSNAGWTLAYYDDRGSREEEAVFDTEDKGCRALFDRVKQMVQSALKRTILI